MVKFKEGFFIKDVSAQFDPLRASCLLVKEKAEVKIDQTTRTEVPLSNTRRLQELTRAGYIGTRMRCIKKDETMDPKDWHVVLKKRR